MGKGGKGGGRAARQRHVVRSGPADRKSAEHSVMKLLNYEMTSQTRLVDYSNLLD